eukprot:931179-Pleurochrysis_carterae.AAC.1
MKWIELLRSSAWLCSNTCMCVTGICTNIALALANSALRCFKKKALPFENKLPFELIHVKLSRVHVPRLQKVLQAGVPVNHAKFVRSHGSLPPAL